MARSRLNRALGAKPTTRRLYGADARAALAASRMLGPGQYHPLLPFPAEPAAAAAGEQITAPPGEHCLHWQDGDADCCRCGLANWCPDGEPPGSTPPPVDGCPGQPQ